MPKPLLEVAGKTILDFIVEKIERVTEIDELIIVTNNKFAGHFEEWRENGSYSKQITVVNDGTLTNETRYLEENTAQVKRAGVVELDESQKVLSFEEKPAEPRSSYCVPAFYLYMKETLPLFREYLEAGNNPDAPGHFVPYLIDKKAVHAFLFEGKRYDIGTVESYQYVKEVFENK